MSNYLLIFDLDGTLVNSKIEYNELKADLRALIHEMVSEKEYELITGVSRSILELVELIAKKDLNGQKTKKAWEIVEDYELRGYENVEIDPDVIPTLEKIKSNGHIIAILTNNSKKLTRIAMKKYEFDKYITEVITRDDVKRTKPDPEGIKKLMTKFDKNADKTIFIGDSWLDAQAAENAGVQFIYFRDKAFTRDKKKKPTDIKLIDTINEILEFI